MRCAAITAVLASATGAAAAQVPFSLVPTWTSTYPGDYATGAGWADINRDGWGDLVTANGNDMARQRVVVYLSNRGVIPFTPDWQSADIDYNGHLSIADVNADGWPDVAVSVYIGPAGFSVRGKVKLYLNNNGTLSATPDWVSRDSVYTFSCAFGDADNDGDPDLAVAAGESYNRYAEQSRIYFNRNGRLDSLPGWRAAQAGYAYDAAWCDFDNDGDLDLVFAGERGPNTMYRNDRDSIRTTPSWTAADATQNANSLFAGDVDGDGWIDLAVADNNQLGGSGRFKIYRNAAGTLASTPAWTSSWGGYGSGITLADIDNDDDLDLLTGGWWQPLRIYLNTGGAFPAAPNWTSSTGSVVEAIVLKDHDHDGLDTTEVSFTGDGARSLFRIPRTHIQGLLSARAGADTLRPGDLWFDAENGWLTLSRPPAPGVTVALRLTVSRDLDMAVSNWDAAPGNYIFRNTTVQVGAGETKPEVATAAALEQNYPNPFNPRTAIPFSVQRASRVRLAVHDLLGREVAVLADEVKEPGVYTVEWNASGMGSGVYVVRLEAAGGILTRAMVLLK
jgi:hypothetical protein